jgi:putative copper export protein
METMVTWLVRYGHVLTGAIWCGGYACLALVLIPASERERSPVLDRLASTLVRALTYTGTATLFFGIILVTRTRGFGNLFSGEWGGIICASILMAIVLLGIGDGALRPALRRLAADGDGRAAKRWAVAGFVITALAIGLMTRAIYAPS